jgi:hypothetical protein
VKDLTLILRHVLYRILRGQLLVAPRIWDVGSNHGRLLDIDFLHFVRALSHNGDNALRLPGDLYERNFEIGR